MKRVICLLLCLFMLPIVIQPAKAAEDETTVRVLLSTNGADTLTVKLSGKYAVGSKTVNGGTVTAKIKNGTITVYTDGTEIGVATDGASIERVR